MKHYLQITERQFLEAAWGEMTGGRQRMHVRGRQDISEKSPTLKNKAFPVIDHHDLSQEIPKWAMRDSSEYAFDPINIESETVAGCPRVAHGVAPMQLGDAVKLLIERWDQLDSGERSSLVEFLLSD